MNILYLTAGNTAPAHPHSPANGLSLGFPITVHAKNDAYQGSFGVGGRQQLRAMGQPDMVYLESHLSEEDERAVIEWIMEQYPDAGIVLVCDEDDTPEEHALPADYPML